MTEFAKSNWNRALNAFLAGAGVWAFILTALVVAG